MFCNSAGRICSFFRIHVDWSKLCFVTMSIHGYSALVITPIMTNAAFCVAHVIKQQNKVIAALCTILKPFSCCVISDRSHLVSSWLWLYSIMSASEVWPEEESERVCLPVPVGTPEAKHPPHPAVENPYSAKALEVKRALEQHRSLSEATLEMNPPTITDDEKERLRQKIGKKDGRRQPRRERKRQRRLRRRQRRRGAPSQSRSSPRRRQSPRQSQ